MRRHLESVDGGGAGGEGGIGAREGEAVDGVCIPDPCDDGAREAREEKRVVRAAVDIMRLRCFLWERIFTVEDGEVHCPILWSDDSAVAPRVRNPLHHAIIPYVSLYFGSPHVTRTVMIYL